MTDVATTSSEILGTNVATIRTRKGMTQAELAAACNLSRPRISEIESGEQNPTVETVENIANALGVSVSRLFSEK